MAARHKVFLDTDVALDHLADRQPFAEYAHRLLARKASPHGMPTRASSVSRSGEQHRELCSAGMRRLNRPGQARAVSCTALTHLPQLVGCSGIDRVIAGIAGRLRYCSCQWKPCPKFLGGKVHREKRPGSLPGLHGFRPHRIPLLQLSAASGGLELERRN